MQSETAGDLEFARWLDWAMQQAERLDPLADSPTSVLDEEAAVKEEINIITPSMAGNSGCRGLLMNSLDHYTPDGLTALQSP